MYCKNVALPLAYFTSAAPAKMGQTTSTLLKDNTLIGERPFEPLSDMIQYQTCVQLQQNVDTAMDCGQ